MSLLNTECIIQVVQELRSHHLLFGFIMNRGNTKILFLRSKCESVYRRTFLFSVTTQITESQTSRNRETNQKRQSS